MTPHDDLEMSISKLLFDTEMLLIRFDRFAKNAANVEMAGVYIAMAIECLRKDINTESSAES
jgi:hypothetical protein